MQLDILGLEKSFGATAALSGIDLSVASGELVALLGPSGSGKTTLLRCVAGLDMPTGGRVLFGGEDALQKPVQQRRIGFVFQHFALFRHMSVADNISYGLRIRPRASRPTRAAIAARVDELLELIQLQGYGNRFPSQLSGGQQQRVALARALAVEPSVLLFDEPFGALDAKVRRELRHWLREFHDRSGHTMLFVTHDQEEALDLADRIVVMNGGRIEQVGTPETVYEQPASPFVFDFIGESVRIDGRSVGGRLEVAGQTVNVPGLALPPDGPVGLYVRPEHVVIAQGGTGLAGRVLSLHRSGSSRRIGVRVEGVGELIEVLMPADRPAPTVGDDVVLDIRAAGLFPA